MTFLSLIALKKWGASSTTTETLLKTLCPLKGPPHLIEDAPGQMRSFTLDARPAPTKTIMWHRKEAACNTLSSVVVVVLLTDKLFCEPIPLYDSVLFEAQLT